jgi:hypothetical protein
MLEAWPFCWSIWGRTGSTFPLGRHLEAKREKSPIPKKYCQWDVVPWCSQYSRHGVWVVSDNGWVQVGHSKEDAKEKCVLLASCFFKHICPWLGGMQEWSNPSEAEYTPSMCKYSFIKIVIHGMWCRLNNSGGLHGCSKASPSSDGRHSGYCSIYFPRSKPAYICYILHTNLGTFNYTFYIISSIPW